MKKTYSPPVIERNVIGMMNKHGHGTSSPVCDVIDGVRVADLLKEHGSPLFIYSERALREKYRAAHRAFSKRYASVQFAWSYKTNYLKAVCQVFHQEGAIAEVVSDFEYDKARNLGVPGHQIIYNGPYKTRASLERAVAEGAKIQIDNLDELLLLEDVARQAGKKPDVGIRVFADCGIQPVWSKFGFQYENYDAYRAIKRIHAGGKLNLTGLHMHVGTFILAPAAYGVAAAKLMVLAEVARNEFGFTVEYIDLGGGFASSNTLHNQYLPGEQSAPSFDAYAEALVDGIHSQLPAGRVPPKLYLETGRALVDDAGYLATTVRAVKRTATGQPAIVVDAGVNLLYTANWYKFNIRPAQPTMSAPTPTVIYGCLCMNIDVLRDQAALPSLGVGDAIVFHPVGAYNQTQSMQFITYRPRAVMIGMNGKVEVIREREDLRYVEEMERLPAHLQPEAPDAGNKLVKLRA